MMATMDTMELEVTSYYVGADVYLDGVQVSGFQISPAYATQAQAAARAADLLDLYPDARVMRQTEYCDDEHSRDRALANIIGGEV